MKLCTNPECPDRERFGVPGEYGEEIELCPRCGQPLGRAPIAEPPVPPSRPESYELAGVVGNAALVPLAKSLLQAEGIAYVTRNEHTQEVFGWGSFGVGFNPLIGAVELWVDSSRLQEATEILSDLERPVAGDADLPAGGGHA